MAKYFLIIALIFCCQQHVLCQDADGRRRDSLRRDSMLRILPSLKDSGRVDCLNSIVEISFGYEKLQTRLDSATSYAIMANNEATQLKYKAGNVKSLLNLARIQSTKFHINQRALAPERNTDDLKKTREGYVRKALLLAEEIQDDELLGRVYYILAEIGGGNESTKKAIHYYRKANNISMELDATVWLCMDYAYSGEYEEGLKYAQRCEELIKQRPAQTEWEHEIVTYSFFNTSMFYKAAGDYKTALNYLFKSEQYVNEHHAGNKWNVEKSELYCLLNKFDSALYYWQVWKGKPDSYVPDHLAYGNSILGLIYLKTNEPDKALAIFAESIITHKKSGRETAQWMPLTFSAQAYVKKKNYIVALNYARQALFISQKYYARPSMIDSYELLSLIFHNLGRDDSAYYYQSKYYQLKDSAVNRQFLWRLNNYEKLAEEDRKTSRINLLNKDNQLKEQKLKQQAFVKNGLVVGLILLFLLGVFVFRTLTLKRKNELQKQQLESEKKQAELQQKATELEMQALRAQMNPHFIFNCLSSINKFILMNDTDAASDYLTRFSRLIRHVLTNAQLSMIPLTDEIEMLRLYLDMERLRFSESFNYNIIYENTIEPDSIYIPPMLLQPFCENAIWHGLMHKQGQGKLEIVMSVQNGELQCIIADNGIGRAKAAELQSKSGAKRKSFGLKLTTERLALFNNDKDIQNCCSTEDVVDREGNVAGTKVTFRIKLKNAFHHPVKEIV